jgi:hypothetical protein
LRTYVEQGFPNDDSDDEWDISIRREYGRREGTRITNPPELDAGINILDAVEHAFHVYDGLPPNQSVENVHTCPTTDTLDMPAPNVGSDEIEETEDMAVEGDVLDPISEPPDLRNSTTQAVLEDSARTLLFAGAQLSSLNATLLILNCLRVHRATNALISELFTLLSKSVLHDINSLPSTKYAASKMLRQLGLSYELIHACSNGCMLFRGVGSENLTKCVKCDKPRFRKVGKSLVPIKVLRFFPLIPRLQRLYSTG